jgi:hypothetical protein
LPPRAHFAACQFRKEEALPDIVIKLIRLDGVHEALRLCAVTVVAWLSTQRPEEAERREFDAPEPAAAASAPPFNQDGNKAHVGILFTLLLTM